MPFSAPKRGLVLPSLKHAVVVLVVLLLTLFIRSFHNLAFSKFATIILRIRDNFRILGMEIQQMTEDQVVIVTLRLAKSYEVGWL